MMQLSTKTMRHPANTTMRLKLALPAYVVLIAVLVYSVGEVSASRMAVVYDGTIPAHPGTESLDSTTLIRMPPTRPPVVNININISAGGPVMSDPIKLYLIWYGTWPESYKAVVRTAIHSLTPAHPIHQYPNLANWWKIVTAYQSNPPHGPHVSDSVSIGGEVDNHYSLGKNITAVNPDPFATVEFKSIFTSAATNLRVANPKALGNLFVLFTSDDVTVGGVPGACGFHFAPELNVAVVLKPTATGGCSPFFNYLTHQKILGTPPNAEVSPDGTLDYTVSILMHELAEAATDPYGTGWMAKSGSSENGDLCNYVFGPGDYQYCGMGDVYGELSKSRVCASSPWTTQTLEDEKSGKTFNLFGVHGSRFLVQQLWSRQTKSCQLQSQDTCTGLVNLTSPTGHIQVGVFVDGKGQQRYAPGEDCRWKISVANAKNLSLTFTSVATGFDRKDHIDVYEVQGYAPALGVSPTPHLVLKTSISEQGLDKPLKLHIEGAEALVRFTSFGDLSPFNEATGFQMKYKAEF